MQVASNGTSFHCRIDGSGGPWVMLAHGLATDLTMWDELTEVLKDHYRVLRYDARGHGGSAATEGDYSLDMLVADAVGILDMLGIAQCHFGGLSMGGMVTLGMLLDHPARITSAVIADSRHTTTPDFTAAWHARAAEVRQGGIEAVVASTVRRWSSEGLAERNPAVIARMETMIRRTSELGYCGRARAARLWPPAWRDQSPDAAHLRQRGPWRTAGEHAANARRHQGLAFPRDRAGRPHLEHRAPGYFQRRSRAFPGRCRRRRGVAESRGVCRCALSPCGRGQRLTINKFSRVRGCSLTPHPIRYVEPPSGPLPDIRAFTPVSAGYG